MLFSKSMVLKVFLRAVYASLRVSVKKIINYNDCKYVEHSTSKISFNSTGIGNRIELWYALAIICFHLKDVIHTSLFPICQIKLPAILRYEEEGKIESASELLQ